MQFQPNPPYHLCALLCLVRADSPSSRGDDPGPMQSIRVSSESSQEDELMCSIRFVFGRQCLTHFYALGRIPELIKMHRRDYLIQ